MSQAFSSNSPNHYPGKEEKPQRTSGPAESPRSLLEAAPVAMRGSARAAIQTPAWRIAERTQGLNHGAGLRMGEVQTLGATPPRANLLTDHVVRSRDRSRWLCRTSVAGSQRDRGGLAPGPSCRHASRGHRAVGDQSQHQQQRLGFGKTGLTNSADWKSAEQRSPWTPRFQPRQDPGSGTASPAWVCYPSRACFHASLSAARTQYSPL